MADALSNNGLWIRVDILIMPYSFDGGVARDLWSSIMKVKMQQTIIWSIDYLTL
jgi:hypothetical protein